MEDQQQQLMQQARDALEWMLDAFGNRDKPPKVMLAMAAVHKARSALAEIDRALGGAAMSPHGDGVNYTRAEGGEDGNDGVRACDGGQQG